MSPQMKRATRAFKSYDHAEGDSCYAVGLTSEQVRTFAVDVRQLRRDGLVRFNKKTKRHKLTEKGEYVIAEYMSGVRG